MWYQDEHQLWAQAHQDRRPEIERLLDSVTTTDRSASGAWMRTTSKVAIRRAWHLVRALFSLRPGGFGTIAHGARGQVGNHG